jgi:hypothetical protein
MIDGRAESPGFSAGADKTIDVEVHQTVRDLEGKRRQIHQAISRAAASAQGNSIGS